MKKGNLKLMFIVMLALFCTGTVADAIKYGRYHQALLRAILDRQPERTVEEAKLFLQENPDDTEAHFLMGVAYAWMGQADSAVTPVKRALDLGHPPSRLIAGPRFLLEPLQKHSAIKALINESTIKPLHGPMIGSVTESSARFWVRTAREATVQIKLRPARSETYSILSSKARSLESSDYTVALDVEGLEPDTRYEYAVEIDGDLHAEPYQQFRTFSRAGSPTKFNLVFGGGAGYYPEYERMWDTVRSLNPAALLMLGDNVYIDDPFRPAMQRYCYYRRQSIPGWRKLAASTSVYAIWDDHDFSDNDSWGGPNVWDPFDWASSVADRWRQGDLHIFLPEAATDTTAGGWNGEGWTPYVDASRGLNDFDLDTDFIPERQHKVYALDASFKPMTWEIFQQNWINPGREDLPDLPGTFYTFSHGDVEFFMLDCRYYRTSPHIPGAVPTMLGPRQKAWLKDRLAESDATFKVIASSVPWDFRSKGKSKDTWNGFREERNELFDFIEQNRVEGVFLVSADRHRSDAYRIPWSDGYDFYEFESSKLTNEGSHGTKEHALFSYNARPSCGLLEFDTTVENPTVTYKIVNIDGEVVYSLTLHRSQLSF